jgi:hypothetical protein
MPMDHQRSLRQLKEALQAHHQALEKLESALVEFEQSISGELHFAPNKNSSAEACNCSPSHSCARS